MNETPSTRTTELFDAMVAAYETSAEPVSARVSQVALRRTTVSAGDRVLDIGAGTGALSLQAAALGASVTAIDLSSAMVARMNQRLAPYPECKALVMDGQALTFEDSTFDSAFPILAATLFSSWSAAPRLIRSKGAIVNILSITSIAPMPVLPGYSISKAAALSLTQSLRALLKRQGVSVHGVILGSVDTDMSRGYDIPKVSPESAAAGIFDGLENGEEESFLIQHRARSQMAGAPELPKRLSGGSTP